MVQLQELKAMCRRLASCVAEGQVVQVPEFPVLFCRSSIVYTMQGCSHGLN